MISQNPSTKTLRSNDTRKLWLKGAQWYASFKTIVHSKHSSNAQIYSIKVWEDWALKQ